MRRAAANIRSQRYRLVAEAVASLAPAAAQRNRPLGGRPTHVSGRKRQPAAVAVSRHFRARPERHWWRTLAAALIGLPGLGIATVLILKNFLTLSGTHSTFVNALPYVAIAAAPAVGAYTGWLRSRRPDRYAQLGSLAALSPAVDA